MISMRMQLRLLLGVVARSLRVRRVVASLAAAFLLAIANHSAAHAQSQSGGAAIYGVTALDVAPSAAAQGVALLQQYREGALKQAGNIGVTLLQEADWPNRFVISESWKDQAAYDANEKAAHTV